MISISDTMYLFKGYKSNELGLDIIMIAKVVNVTLSLTLVTTKTRNAHFCYNSQALSINYSNFRHGTIILLHSNLDIVNKSVRPFSFTISNVICLVIPQNGSWVLFTISQNSLY